MKTQYNKYPELKDLSEKERMKHYYRAYRQRNPQKMIWRAAKDRAKLRGLEFSIEPEDIIIPEICPILGIKIVVLYGNGVRGGKENSASLDRIDNTKGYVKSNIQVICNKANSMKFTASPNELKQFADWINKTYD